MHRPIYKTTSRPYRRGLHINWGALSSFVIFMLVCGSAGLWWAGLFGWVFFYFAIMPRSWKE